MNEAHHDPVRRSLAIQDLIEKRYGSGKRLSGYQFTEREVRGIKQEDIVDIVNNIAAEPVDHAVKAKEKGEKAEKHFFYRSIFDLPPWHLITFQFLDKEIQANYLKMRKKRLEFFVKQNAGAFIVLQLLFGLIDLLYEKDNLKMLSFFRYGVILPLLLIGMLIINKYSNFWKYNQLIFSAMVLTFGAGLLTSGYIATNVPDFYFVSLNFAMGVGYCFLMVNPYLMMIISGLFMGMVSFNSYAIIDDVVLSRAALYNIVYFFFWGIFTEVQVKQEFMLKRSLKLEKKQLIADKETSEQLLTNILPKLIAERVKRRENIADGYQTCTVMFAKVFFEEGGKPEPLKEFARLHEIISAFDSRITFFNLEKIKTIGNVYMVAGGVPSPSIDHCRNVAYFSLEMIEIVKSFNEKNKCNAQVRIGFHCGPVVAGVLGTLKMVYDLWGDTCNVASRMESNSDKGNITTTGEVAELLQDEFNFEKRGSLEIKGKGKMDTFYLIAHKETASDEDKSTTEENFPDLPMKDDEVKPAPVGKFQEVKAYLTKVNKIMNLFTLRFREGEQDFSRHYAMENRWIVFTSLFLCLIVTMVSIPEEIRHPSARLGLYYGIKAVSFVVFSTSLTIIWYFEETWKKHSQKVSILSWLPIAAHVAIGGSLVGNHLWWYFGITVVFALLFLRIKFAFALPLGLLLYISFHIAHHTEGTFKSPQSYAVIIHTAVNLVLSAISFFSEILGRFRYRLLLQLDEKKKQVKEEKERSEELLLNILPKSVIHKLKYSKKADPEEYSDVTILFADIVGFTSFCSNKTAKEVVASLGELFSIFDQLTIKYGLEKLKTIGDCFVVAGGLPTRSLDHTQRVLNFALDMMNSVQQFNKGRALKLQIRVGVHTGPCVAGIIGTKRFAYDVLGEAMSVANLAESLGAPGQIHVTERTKLVASQSFIFQPRDVNIAAPNFRSFSGYFLTMSASPHDQLSHVIKKKPEVKFDEVVIPIVTSYDQELPGEIRHGRTPSLYWATIKPGILALNLLRIVHCERRCFRLSEPPFVAPLRNKSPFG